MGMAGGIGQLIRRDGQRFLSLFFAFAYRHLERSLSATVLIAECDRLTHAVKAGGAAHDRRPNASRRATRSRLARSFCGRF